MDKDTIVRRTENIWQKGNFRQYAYDRFQEYLNLTNRDFIEDTNYTPLEIFSVVEWASATLSSDLYLQNKWFYIEDNIPLTDRLYKNLALIDWDKKVKKALKAFFVTGAIFMLRYNPQSYTREKTEILNEEELKKLQKNQNVEILEKRKVSKIPTLYEVKFVKHINRILVDVEIIKPTRIEFSYDFKEVVRQIFIGESELKKYPRRVIQLYRELQTEDEPFYLEAYEYYKDNKMYLIVNKEVIASYTLPCSKPPFVFVSPIDSVHMPLGYTLVDILKDIQKANTTLSRALIKNTKDFVDYKVLYNPTVINKQELLGRDKFLKLKNPDITPNNAMAFIQKAQNILPPTITTIEFLKGEQENVSGFTRYNRGLQGKGLSNTATGITLLMQAGQLRLKDYLQRFLFALKDVLTIMAVYMGYDRDIKLAIREEKLSLVKQEKLQKLLQLVQLSPQAFNPYVLIQRAAKLLDFEDIQELLVNPQNVNTTEGSMNGEGK